MESRKFVLKETAIILLGEVICSAAMVGIFALLGAFDLSVVLGAIVGSVISTLNFFLMAVGANLAADKAANQDVKGGQALIQMSYMGRLLGIGLILILCAKSGIFNLIALVIPLVFTRPILTIGELLNKKGGNNP